MRWRLFPAKPPKLFLDIDGVLAPFAMRQPDMEPVKVGGYHGTIVTSPTVINRVADLHIRRVVCVEWLTSWEDDANTMLAPLVGLGQYTVHMEPTIRTERYWKEPVVREHGDTGARFIWVDDEMTDYNGHITVAADYPNGLIIAPDSSIGLTHEHLDLIEAFATAA